MHARLIVLCATLLTSIVAAAAPADTAAEQLDRQGRVPVTHVGPHVSIGTYRIQVIAKLGQPSARLSEDTWLYHERAIAASEAQGTLVIHFTHGRVTALSLVTPALAAAMQEAKPTSPSVTFARKD